MHHCHSLPSPSANANAQGCHQTWPLPTPNSECGRNKHISKNKVQHNQERQPKSSNNKNNNTTELCGVHSDGKSKKERDWKGDIDEEGQKARLQRRDERACNGYVGVDTGGKPGFLDTGLGGSGVQAGASHVVGTRTGKSRGRKQKANQIPHDGDEDIKVQYAGGRWNKKNFYFHPCVYHFWGLRWE